jgi:hypothetical protein
MSIDPKKFGLSDSLVGAVNEALKGKQVKLDKNHNGKLDAQDFKMLRKEDAKPDYLDFDKDGNKKESMKKAIKDKKMKSEGTKEQEDAVDEQTPGDYDKANFKHKMMKEAAPAASGVADQMAAKKDALKTQIQRKIAQKQMDVMKSKANKRLSSMKEGTKCSCGDTNESKMKCEMHGGKDKETKGGREAIVMNPPLKEASNLPKKVVSKGHEIAKSLIKHKSKVREPYAVGMAAAKKSAGIKD